MKKKLVDDLSGILVILAIFALPIFKKTGMDASLNTMLTYAAIVICIVLVLKVIGYFTKYTKEERQADLKMFGALTLIAIALLMIARFYHFY